MGRRWLGYAIGFVALVGGVIAALSAATQPPASSPGIAFLAIDLASGRVVASERAAQLDLPVAPGSVMKVAALAAALDSGAVSERTGILCNGQASVAGHQLTCTHPDLHRPLKAGEALAHSCNVFFATIAPRVPRAAFDRVLGSLGLPPSDPGQPLAAAALGLEGIRVSPRQLLEMMKRVAAEPSTLGWQPSTHAAVRDALRAAATVGTAAALRAQGIDALAKTGTTVADGRSQGLVVGVTPPTSPRVAFVLLTSGASGADAAALAAERLGRLEQKSTTAQPPHAFEEMLRVGVTAADGRVAVREMALDDYVAGVVAGEAAPASAPAALQALAITARTFALANRGRHAGAGFDLCDLTHCQVLRPESAVSRRASIATTGQVLLDRGRPASIFYTASCGGHSEKPSAVWRGAVDPPFLPSRPDAACEGEPVWRSELEIGAVMRALAAGGFRGDLLRDIAVTSRTASGRVAWLRLDGMTPPEISGDDFRTLVGRTAGWQWLKSTAFAVSRSGRGFRFEGHGAGHGVGLCVLGSSQRAARGESTQQILASYFPGLSIGAVSLPAASASRKERSAAGVEVGLMLPSADQSEHEPLVSLARRTLAGMAGRLQVDLPSRLALRFHPTVESYQRATKQPWFTAATTSSSGIDFLPLTVLRRRGILEPTLAHEIVHVLTAPVLSGRPAWVVEGVAVHFAGESAEQSAVSDRNSATRSTCPTDAEILHPANEASLRGARERAGACIAERLGAGQQWRNIH